MDLTVDTHIDFAFNPRYYFFFSKVCKNLSNNFGDNDPSNFKKFITDKVDSSIFMEPPCVYEVFNHINSLSLQKLVNTIAFH